MNRTPEHLANLLGAFALQISDEVHAALAERFGLSGATPAALLALETWPGRSIQFLRGVLDLTHGGAVRVVDRLERDGLARREPGPDRRTVTLRLTTRGEHAVEAARSARREVLDAALGTATDAERTALLALLHRSLRGTSRTRTEARHACRLCDHSVCRGDDCPIGASVP